LGSILERIWQTLISIPGDQQRSANLESLKRTGVQDRLYRQKTASAFHFGPYAMLVRESAFWSREMRNHDYLGVPEIIEDICNDYKQRFGTTIETEISTALKPCIVKFEVEDDSASSLVENALRYCWCKANGHGLDFGANNCFDGKGKAIPHENIRKIEFCPIK
jgi:hypothetical protein